MANIVSSASYILSDPDLPEVIDLVSQLHDTAGGSGTGVSTGVGLSEIVTPLRGYVFYRNNRWVLPLAIAAIIGIPFLLGYKYGKGR